MAKEGEEKGSRQGLGSGDKTGEGKRKGAEEERQGKRKLEVDELS